MGTIAGYPLRSVTRYNATLLGNGVTNVIFGPSEWASTTLNVGDTFGVIPEDLHHSLNAQRSLNSVSGPKKSKTWVLSPGARFAL